MRADTDRLAATLDRIIADAWAIRDQLRDLDLIAYEQPTNSDEIHVKSSRDYALDNIGAPAAKLALRNLTRHAQRITEQLHTDRVAVFAMFAGEGADLSLRGTTISRAAFEEQQKALARRRAAPNDYVPARIEAQPKYPRGSR